MKYLSRFDHTLVDTETLLQAQYFLTQRNNIVPAEVPASIHIVSCLFEVDDIIESI